MKKFLLGIIVALVIVFTFRFCENKREDRITLEASSALIQKELKNVGKLVVTEGSYAQVFSYNASKDLLYGLTDATRKVVVVVNAKATMAYDRSKIETQIYEA